MKTRAIAALSVLAASLMLGAAAQPPAKRADTVAIIGDRDVIWPDLAPTLAEAAGGQVLEEYALGIVLKEETDKRGITIGEAQIKAERTLLGQMLTQAARVPETEAESLITSIRRTRGLGEIRFRGLLERNAALRALVRGGVGDVPISISGQDLDTAYELKYGPRVRARLILVRTKEVGKRALDRLAAGAPFSDVAAELSLDPSAARGGLLDPFSLSDPTYPLAVRERLKAMKPGETSEPLSVTWGGGRQAERQGGLGVNANTEETGFAIVKLEDTVPAAKAAPTRHEAEKELEREVRTVRERARMDTLARQLLRGAGVTVMDPALNWSWEQRGGGK